MYHEVFGKTAFLSLYAATDPLQEFADAFAYYLMNQNLDTLYHVETSSGVQYDVMSRVSSPEFSAHFKFLREFLDRKDIVYP